MITRIITITKAIIAKRITILQAIKTIMFI